MPLPASRRQCSDGGAPRRPWSGFSLPGQIVDAIDAAGHDRTNELLLALIRLFQNGHQLAGRVVLQALLPKLAKTATHAGGMCTSSSDTWAEDRRHITIAEFWDVMADYPVHRRTSSVASNLSLDTLHRITGARKPPTSTCRSILTTSATKRHETVLDGHGWPG
jgi:hypothetical protein